MIKEHERLLGSLLIMLDVVLALAAYVAAYFLRNVLLEKPGVASSEYLTLGLVVFIAWFLLLKFFGFDRLYRLKSYSVMFLESFFLIVLGLLVVFFFSFAFQLKSISRLVILLFALIDFFFLYGLRILVFIRLRNEARKGHAPVNCVIVADESCMDMIQTIVGNQSWGYRIIGVVDDEFRLKAHFEQRQLSIPCFRFSDFERVLVEGTIDEVFLCRSFSGEDELRYILYLCGELGIGVSIKSDVLRMIASRGRTMYLGDIQILAVSGSPLNYFSLALKRIFDYAFSGLFLLGFLPFFPIVAIAIKLSSKGPVFFCQKRIGLHGRQFTLYKFRTMVVNAEKLREQLAAQNEVDGPVFKIKNDPRLTPVGKFLRKTSIDEIPQFLNVLLGDMSVIGPRPPLPEEVAKYERWQRRRLSMKPGITCLWQVSGRNRLTFEQWMQLDMEYIDHWNLKLDALIFLRTIKTVLLGDGQ